MNMSAIYIEKSHDTEETFLYEDKGIHFSDLYVLDDFEHVTYPLSS